MTMMVLELPAYVRRYRAFGVSRLMFMRERVPTLAHRVSARRDRWPENLLTYDSVQMCYRAKSAREESLSCGYRTPRSLCSWLAQ